MLCKIKYSNMFYRVCLPDGSPIPCQTSSSIYQHYKMPKQAKVTFRALSDLRIKGEKIESRGGSLWVGEREVPGVLSYRVITAKSKRENDEIEVSLICDVFEDQEQMASAELN